MHFLNSSSLWRVAAFGLAAACSAVAPGQEGPAKAEKPSLPTGLCAVEEMQFIPEVDSWERCDPKAYADAVQNADKAWPNEAKRIEGYVTPELAQRLSRWSKKQMEGYTHVPPLEKIALEPVRHYPKGNKLLLRGTVDTLPTHAPLVTRWLQVYVLCDSSGKSIDRVTVTIRGERQE
jgi:hypothetical protein